MKKQYSNHIQATKLVSDSTDFLEEMGDVRPIKSQDKVYFSGSHIINKAPNLKRQAIEQAIAGEKNYLTLDSIDLLEPDDLLDYKKDGVQEGVYKNLRLGKYTLDHTLDLTHNKLPDAQQLVFNSIINCHRQGKRNLLIKHGFGRNQKPYPAMTKSYTNVWLRQMPEVIAFHSAQPSHGGYAAVYVLLRKNENQKQINRERHKQR